MADPDQAVATAGDPDDELEAIADIMNRLKPLSRAGKRRVVAFVADRVGVSIAPTGDFAGRATSGTGAGSVLATPPAELPTYRHFAQLANRVRPETELFKVLIACYWVQVVEGTSPFGTKHVNPRLTEISVGLGHVTERLQDLQEMNPSYVIHIKEPGQTKKSYLLTDEGIAAVQEAIRSGGFAKPAKKGPEPR